jgi:hypothetical protein
MIGGWRILSGENGVAEVAFPAFKSRPILLDPSRKPGPGQGPRRIQPPAMRRVRSPLGIIGKGTAGSRIQAARIAMRRGERLGYVGPRAEAGVDQAFALQRLQRLAI